MGQQPLSRLDLRSAQQQVLESLRSAILTGALKPGQRLRQEEVALRLGVSRMPVREALRTLEAEGFVRLHPHRAAEVAQLSVAELREIYDVRIALETMALRYSAAHLSESCFKSLERLLRRMDAAAGRSSGEWVALNLRFHRELYTASGRPFLCGLIDNLRARSSRYLHLSTTHSGRMTQAQAEHWAIVAACRKGRIEEAVALLRDHLENTVRALLAVLEGTPEGTPEGSAGGSHSPEGGARVRSKLRPAAPGSSAGQETM